MEGTLCGGTLCKRLLYLLYNFTNLKRGKLLAGKKCYWLLASRMVIQLHGYTIALLARQYLVIWTSRICIVYDLIFHLLKQI